MQVPKPGCLGLSVINGTLEIFGAVNMVFYFSIHDQTLVQNIAAKIINFAVCIALIVPLYVVLQCGEDKPGIPESPLEENMLDH